jgi:hypothetical protein
LLWELLERELLFVSMALPELALLVLARSRLQLEPALVSLLLPVPPVLFWSLQPTNIAAEANTMSNFFIVYISLNDAGTIA